MGEKKSIKVPSETEELKKPLSKEEFKERQKAMDELCGIVKDLPPADYSGTIDEVLYGDKP